MALSVLVSLLLLIIAEAAKVDDAGFGSQYDWHSLEDGYVEAEKTGKPIMFVMHKSWCGACKALKPQFAKSASIEKLSKKFVMVIAGDDDAPTDSKFAVDGTYIPRIYFMNPDKSVIDAINEFGNPSYKYYYGSISQIEASMKKALASSSVEKREVSQEEL
ncbi:thioredoxin domain-containing protein 12-like isoform X2 [Neocloeon triangulifer]|uniref:thioredoxin domain-containing protein 12-like isoform X2 n=1 Tax=Neocloeon triangulifer TaxID=2078957 RepID=UPI00286F4961|nr:thioredoxin domain-containing protein 12-like isoform X2 [Neocloeon triangulifer]